MAAMPALGTKRPATDADADANTTTTTTTIVLRSGKRLLPASTPQKKRHRPPPADDDDAATQRERFHRGEALIAWLRRHQPTLNLISREQVLDSEALNLMNCGIAVLPDAIVESMAELMPRLKLLNLNGNTLYELPPSFARRLAPQLIELRLAGNRLDYLPPNLMHALTRCRVLHLSDNGLRAFNLPSMTQLPLRELLLSNNRLDHTPNGLRSMKPHLLPHLRVLDLSNNRLQNHYLPDPWPPALQQLSLEYNQLTRFPRALPASLTLLLLDHNHITSIPTNAVAHLLALRTLSMQHNALTHAALSLSIPPLTSPQSSLPPPPLKELLPSLETVIIHRAPAEQLSSP